MACSVVQVAARESTRIVRDVDVPVKEKPLSSEILLIPLPPRIGSFFGPENDNGHRHFLPTNSRVEEMVIPHMANFRSSCAKTKDEEVNACCLSNSLDEELQISLGHESIIIGFVESTHVPKADVCVPIERDWDVGKR